MRLNRKQRLVLSVACVLFVACFVFTPWDKMQLISNSKSVIASTQYYVIFSLPQMDSYYETYRVNWVLVATSLIAVTLGSVALLLVFADSSPRAKRSEEQPMDDRDYVEFEIFKLKMSVHWSDLLVGMPHNKDAIVRVIRGTYLLLKHWEECGEGRPDSSDIQRALEAVHIRLEDRPLPEELTVSQRMLVDYWLAYLRRLGIVE